MELLNLTWLAPWLITFVLMVLYFRQIKRKPNKEKPEVGDKMSYFLFLGAAVCALWILSIFVIQELITDSGKRAAFGDSFGAINSLFSGLALAGIIYTILLQRRELALQRQELELTRKELARSADAQEQSQRELSRQSANLKMTARLNAYSTLINHCRDEERWYQHESEMHKIPPLREERLHYVGKIKQILSEKEGR